MSDSEAFAPAVVDMSRFQIQDKPVDNSTGQRKRGPGRPPGARNKTKIPEGGINTPQKLILDGGRRNPPKDETLEDAAKREKLEQAKREAEGRQRGDQSHRTHQSASISIRLRGALGTSCRRRSCPSTAWTTTREHGCSPPR